MKAPPKKKPRKQKEVVSSTGEKQGTIKEKPPKSKTKKDPEKADDVLNTGILKKEKEVTFVNPKLNEKEALMPGAGEMEIAIKIEVIAFDLTLSVPIMYDSVTFSVMPDDLTIKSWSYLII